MITFKIYGYNAISQPRQIVIWQETTIYLTWSATQNHHFISYRLQVCHGPLSEYVIILYLLHFKGICDRAFQPIVPETVTLIMLPTAVIMWCKIQYRDNYWHWSIKYILWIVPIYIYNDIKHTPVISLSAMSPVKSYIVLCNVKLQYGTVCNRMNTAYKSKIISLCLCSVMHLVSGEVPHKDGTPSHFSNVSQSLNL
jgi:hypothetical protein